MIQLCEISLHLAVLELEGGACERGPWRRVLLLGLFHLHLRKLVIQSPLGLNAVVTLIRAIDLTRLLTDRGHRLIVTLLYCLVSLFCFSKCIVRLENMFSSSFS